MAQNLAHKEKYGTLELPVQYYPQAPKQTRWSQLDMARGIAIALMILSHCVKGLLAHSMIPDWGLIPVHLVTKFSSSLFIIVFGMSVSLYFVPHINKNTWSKKRFWMIKRGIELMIWYKLLTVVQMFQFYPEPMIIDTLLFKRMPDFVEILCFYSIALMWIPFFLPVWSRMGFTKKAILIVVTLLAGQWLHHNFDFWGFKTLKAVLVEEKGFFTFGQFQRGSLIFLGLFLGDVYKKFKDRKVLNNLLPLACAGFGSLSLSYFYFSNSTHFKKSLINVAGNVGKHPFDINFLSFSLGGALLVLGICLLVSNKTQKIMKPITYLGKHSLNAFILHIIIIFYFYRYVFALHRKVSYSQSLFLTVACIGSVLLILYFWNKFKAAIK